MRWLIGLGVVLVVTGLAPAGGTAGAAARLWQAYPQVRLYSDGAGQSAIWGADFGSGASAVETAAEFVRSYSELYGVTADELALGNPFNGQATDGLMFDPQTGSDALTLVYFTQVRDGIPVWRSELRLAVRNQPGYPLVWAGASLHQLGTFVVPTDARTNRHDELAYAAALARHADLQNFGPAELVIWPGDKQNPPAVALVFEADNGQLGTLNPGKWRFVADAVRGTILHEENRIIATDVVGQVHALATTIPKSAECNPEVDMVMPYAQVAIGSTSVFADAQGNFTIPNSGNTQVTVTSYMSGQRFVVNEQSNHPLETLTATVTPPGPANFLHNAANNDPLTLAQVNAYVQANVVRDWVLVQDPAYPTIANQTGFPLNVNIGLTCNAYYDGFSLNFYQAGGGCANTAYSSVVHHEYGHHIVESGGSGQDEYGEGMGDTVAVLIADDPVIGYGFQNDCNNGIRTANNNFQYPCSGEIHYCGQLISGCVWSTRNELRITNPNTYLSILSKLTLNSVKMHTGGTITPVIYTAFITLDNTYYGGIHQAEITNGFAAHNMVPLPPPPNDACANAIAICPGDTTGNTSSATLDGGTTCDGSSPGPDVWYSYTPASSGSATIKLCNSSVIWDSVLSIHSACPGNTNNQLNCSDDDCGGVATHGTITRNVVAGTTYIIRVGGYSDTDAGAFTLTVTGPPCVPSNYTLTTNVVGQGSISLDPPGGSYPPGTVVTVTATHVAHWRFDKWTGDLNGPANPTTITMTRDMNVTAVFGQLGDSNCDGAVNFDDINPFVLALGDPAGYHTQYPNCEILHADCNGDGLVNFDDINPFVALLTGP